MKKLYLTILALAGIIPVLNAGTTWTLQDKTYNVDTLYHAKIGPGTTQTSLALTGGSRLNIFYITTDLTDPYVDIRVTKASDKLVGCQTLSTMCSNNTAPGARYFAGVNADFFGNSQPIGSTVVNSEVYYGNPNNWVNWFMTEDKKPGIGTLGFSGTASAGEASCPVSGINIPRYENCLVLFTDRFGANTGTNSAGYEVSIEPLDGAVGFVGKQRFRVTSAPASAGSMAIPASGYVLSGHGTAALFVSALTIGQTVTLDLNPSIAGFEGKKIAQMASGQPAILSKGVTLETQGALDHLTALNPRTAVGFDETGTKLVLLVVDGRGTSVGVVSKVLADIMRETGCTEAMNFDGGGSSELYTSYFGVRNKPSDGRERAVTNAVWAVAAAPEDSEIAEIRFEATAMELPKYGFYKPVIYAYNKYGVLLDANRTEGITLSCPDALGQITDNGTTLFSNGSGTHALTAHYGNISASIPVTIGTGEPKFVLNSLLLDNRKEYTTEVTAATSKAEMPIDNIALKWESENPEVAIVTERGVIKGISEGKTAVKGTLDNFTGSIDVTVEIPSARRLDISLAPQSDTDWATSKTGLKSIGLSASGEKGIAVDYTVSSTRGTAFAITKKLTAYSLPDSLRIVINPLDSKIKQLILTMEDAAGNSMARTYTPVFEQNKNNVLLFPVSDFFDTDNLGIYPVSFSSLRIYLSDPTGKPLRIEIPEMNGVYTALSESGGIDDVIDDSFSGLKPVLTPNPVNCGENVAVSGIGQEEAAVAVFTSAGKCVGAGRISENGTIMAPGTPGFYIVSVTTGNKTRSASLIVK